MFETSHTTKSTSTPVNLLVKLWLFIKKEIVDAERLFVKNMKQLNIKRKENKK